jgi:hypothetical protein
MLNWKAIGIFILLLFIKHIEWGTDKNQAKIQAPAKISGI